MLECPWMAPGRHWLGQQLSAWAADSVTLTTEILLGSKEPTTVHALHPKVRGHWHTLRCFALVAIWDTYKAFLPKFDPQLRRYVTAAERAEESGSGDAYRQNLGGKLVSNFASLLEMELDFAWRRALSGVKQELRGGGTRLRGGGGVQRLAETWCRNGVFATIHMAGPNNTASTLTSRINLMSAGTFLGTRPAGWRVLDLSGGMPTMLVSILNSGRRCERYIQAEGDRRTRLISEHIIDRLGRECGSQIDTDATTRHAGFPSNVVNISEETIIALGRIDLFIASWPNSELPRVNRMATQVTEGLCFHMEYILTWVLRHNPHCHYMFANLEFRDSFPQAWRITNRSLGNPVVWDVALISLAPGMIAVWSSFFTPTNVPVCDMNIQLADALDRDHVPRSALYTDAAPYAEINVIPHPMRRYVAVDNTRILQSIRDGSGLVERRSSPGQFERPRVEEMERILGFQTGDTDAPELPEGLRTSSRQIALGSCFDVRP